MHAEQNSGYECLAEQPTTIIINAFFRVPSSLSKKKREALFGQPHLHKPDADNIGKILLDALNTLAYEDDKQINTLLDALRHDREKSRIMQSDGSYIREKGGKGTGSQEALYHYFSSRKVKPDDAPAEPADQKNETPKSGRRSTRIRAAADRDKTHGESGSQNTPA